jgi:hypothetical protein
LNASQEYLRNDVVLNTKKPDLNNNVFQTDARDIKDRFEKTDFSFAIDIGTDITLSKTVFLTAGLRGNYGFKDINTEPYRLKTLTENTILRIICGVGCISGSITGSTSRVMNSAASKRMKPDSAV